MVGVGRKRMEDCERTREDDGRTMEGRWKVIDNDGGWLKLPTPAFYHTCAFCEEGQCMVKQNDEALT